jgi:hypothetical protein
MTPTLTSGGCSRSGPRSRALAKWIWPAGGIRPDSSVLKAHRFCVADSLEHITSLKRDPCLRYTQIFDPPGSVTLWRLTDPIEERLETVWEGWVDDAKSWRPFFERVATIRATDLSACLTDLDLVTADEVAATRSLKKSSDGRFMQMPDLFDGSRKSVAMLALAFGNGSPGNLMVPYARRADA